MKGDVVCCKKCGGVDVEPSVSGPGFECMECGAKVKAPKQKALKGARVESLKAAKQQLSGRPLMLVEAQDQEQGDSRLRQNSWPLSNNPAWL